VYTGDDRLIDGVKGFARRHFPDAVSAIHSFRFARQRNSRRVSVTPFGFRFGGHPAMEDGSYELSEAGVIAGFCSPGTVFVDVGANYGYFSCLARQAGAHVIAIEPVQSNLEILYRNFVVNDWNDIEVLPLGLAAKPGISTIYGAGTAASMVQRWSGASETWKSPIALSTLDIVLSDRFAGEPLFIKIDVEGVELQVLQGSVKTLARNPAPAWLVEIVLTEHHPAGLNPAFGDVFDLFRAAGYIAFTLGPEARVVTKDDVAQWIALRRRQFGYWSYLFRKTAA
jgi:FkbM family methyltransferase